ncbi:hypothetical protein ANO11243_007120 [Dothideomycetidae sp. 11243]|nr:hypothetical protein ANO11243_007120 [fungal sp. No.11243]
MPGAYEVDKDLVHAQDHKNLSNVNHEAQNLADNNADSSPKQDRLEVSRTSNGESVGGRVKLRDFHETGELDVSSLGANNAWLDW